MPKPKLIDVSSSKSWSHCRRRVWYDYNPPANFLEPSDRFEELIADLGLQHEQEVLAKFAQYAEAESIEHTKQLMTDRTPVIYQAFLTDPAKGLVGRPDFLILDESGEYQAADAKLARSFTGHKEILIQVALYRHLLGSDLPGLVYFGNGETGEVDQSADKHMHTFLRDVDKILSGKKAPPTHFSHSKCSVCPYDEICRPSFEKNKTLTLAYGLDARSVDGLRAQGIDNLSDLACADPNKIEDVPYLKGTAKKARAVLQAKSYLSEQPIQFADLKLPNGSWVHFDIESNPLSEGSGQVYLWGFLLPPYDKADFDYVWADESEQSDHKAWLAFLEKVSEYRSQYPELILAHFSNFEVNQIKAYAKRFEMENDTRVEWLLGDESPLFDMLPALKDAICLPLTGYGLKAVCKDPDLVNFQWELTESGSQWSVVRYIDYLLEDSSQVRAKIKDEILTYNRDDVRATRALEEWLRASFRLAT